MKHLATLFVLIALASSQLAAEAIRQPRVGGNVGSYLCRDILWCAHGLLSKIKLRLSKPSKQPGGAKVYCARLDCKLSF